MSRLAVNVREEILKKIPSRWKNWAGPEFYDQYWKLRVKGLHGKVLCYGANHKIEYTLIETGKSKKLVFLPGFADTKENFYNAAQCLLDEFDIAIPDLPGFGKSFKLKDELHNLPQYELWLQEFLDHLGWDEIHLVGNSLGGAIAVRLAIAQPQRYKSLCLIDCAGVVLASVPSIYHEFVKGRNIFHISTEVQFEYFLNRVFFQPPLIPLFVKEHLYHEFVRHSKWHKKVLQDLLEGVEDLSDPRVEHFSLNAQLKNISVPTLILWGDEDSFFPVETARFVHQEIKDSRLYVLANRGHAPQVEAPLQTAKLIKKFSRRLGQAKS